MAQISYGTITITDTTDIERIYPVYCKGGETNAPSLQPLTNWSENVSQAGGSGDYIWQRIVTKKQDITPTASDYSDAVRLTGDSGTSLTITSIQYAQTQNENDTPSYSDSMPSSINEGWWLWVKTTYSDSNFVITKVKQGQKGDTGDTGTSIVGTRELYWLKTNSSNPSQITWNSSTLQPSASIYSNDRVNAWTSIVPTYVVNGVYYTCIENTLSNSTKTWSAPIINNALTNANKNAYDALQDAQYTTDALNTKFKYFFYPGDSSYPGVYATGGINGTTLDEEDISTYGYNVSIKPAEIGIGYNNIKAIKIDGSTPSLKFYYPSKTTQATYPTMELTSAALIFYESNSNNKKMELTSSDLNFYGSSQSAPDATISSTGLVLKKGGIESGNVTSGNGYVYLSTEDKSGITINGHTPDANDPAWRAIIGTKFGVDAEGNLYASNANVRGTINATSGTIGGWTIGTSAIYNGTNSKTSTNVGTYIGTDAIRNYNTATQYIHIENGKITAKNVDLSGKITASSGQIGTWLIGTDTNKSLCYEDSRPGQTTSNLVLSTDAINQNYSIGNSEIGEHWFISAGQVFGVTTAGKVYSSSFDFGNGSSCIIFDSSDAEPALQIMGASIFLGSSGTNISETLDSLQNTDNQLNSSVQSSNQRIDNLNESYTNFSNTITGQVSTLESNQNSMNNEIIRIDGTVESYLGENGYIYMHYDESDPYLEIGRTLKNVHFSVRLYSDIMGFYQDDEQVAYIGANQLYIKNSRITNEMRVGNFKWQPRDGRMTLMYSPLEE